MTTLPPVKRGDTWKFVFSWKNNNTAIDLTGASARMQVRTKRTGVMLAEVTTSENDISIDGPTGTVTVTFPASVTAGVEIGTHVSDLQVTFLDNTVQSSSTIQIVVEEDITR